MLQVVLLTSGADERPFKLAWPPGTLIFLVGCAEEHAAAREAAKAGRLAVPEGCLLRRVPADLKVRALPHVLFSVLLGWAVRAAWMLPDCGSLSSHNRTSS